MGIKAGIVAYSETNSALTAHSNYSIFYKKNKPSKLDSHELSEEKPSYSKESQQKTDNKPKRKICFEMEIDDESDSSLKLK